ncbi:MAG: class I SAM-dependent methyltransferase [Planctomycetota bacterium]
MKQLLRDAAASLILRLPRGALLDRKYFKRYQRRGIHIVPNDFYYPVPDTDSLDERVWTEPSEMRGIDMQLDRQIALLEELDQGYLDEYHQLPEKPVADRSVYARHGGFGWFDGALLYGMIRKLKPHRVVEIGCGQSTLLSKLALAKNRSEDDAGKLTSIDPYPRDYLADVGDEYTELVKSKVEDLPLSTFEDLEQNDILFIDSSHTVHIGGDTVFEILEILPRLKPGVHIHIHDICFPFNYPKSFVVDRLNFWAEQYMLQAFLAFNSAFQVRWSLTYMQAYAPDALHKAFPYFKPGIRNMGSAWIERVG